MRRRSPGEGARAESSARKQAPAARKSLISSAPPPAARPRPHPTAPGVPAEHGHGSPKCPQHSGTRSSRWHRHPRAAARGEWHCAVPPPCTHGHTHSPPCPRHHHARQNCDGASWSLGTLGVAGTGAVAQAPKSHPRCPVPAPLAQLHERSPAPVSPPAGFWGRGSVPDAHQKLGEVLGGQSEHPRTRPGTALGVHGAFPLSGPQRPGKQPRITSSRKGKLRHSIPKGQPPASQPQSPERAPVPPLTPTQHFGDHPTPHHLPAASSARLEGSRPRMLRPPPQPFLSPSSPSPLPSSSPSSSR